MAAGGGVPGSALPSRTLPVPELPQHWAHGAEKPPSCPEEDPLPVTTAGLPGTEHELGPTPSVTLPGSLSSVRKAHTGPKPSTVTFVPTWLSPANEHAGKGAFHPPAQAEPRAGRKFTPQTS